MDINGEEELSAGVVSQLASRPQHDAVHVLHHVCKYIDLHTLEPHYYAGFGGNQCYNRVVL